MSSPGSGAWPPAGDGDRGQGFHAADDEDGADQSRRRAGGRTRGSHRARKSDGLLTGFGRSRARPDRGAGSEASAGPDAGAAPAFGAAPGNAAWPDAEPA